MIAAAIAAGPLVPLVTASPIPLTAVSVSAAKKKKTTSKKKRTTTSSNSKKKVNTSKKKTTKKKRTTSKKTNRKKGVSNRWTTAKPQPEAEKPSNDSLTLLVNSRLLSLIPPDQNPGGLRVNRVTPEHKAKLAKISLNDNFTYLPVTQELISQLENEVRRSLPDSISDYRIALNVGKHTLGYYITKVQPLPQTVRRNIPFVVELDPYIHPKKGMEGDILALWHSHGRYYKPSAEGWMWQRPFLFQSLEDTYTMGYVLPFLVPMLENAGAYVMLPRERDLNSLEVIVDNDTNPDGNIYSQPYYKEKNSIRKWSQGEGEGFIYDLPDFRDTENPFENGTYRQVQAQVSGEPAVAAWYADIPEDGEYAVYVSYKTLPNSVSDARYTVNYSGGSKEFKVNQTMGGGTWIYLGTFPLEKGYDEMEPIVTLTNLTSGSTDRIVTADAIKIGGGMGNISRSPRRSDILYDPSTPAEDPDEEEVEEDEETDLPTIADEDVDASVDQQPASLASSNNKNGSAPRFSVSGLPRYLEGARYWLHWAGFPESVYSPYHGTDDYKDDYTSRALWVNYLAGGSRVLPEDEGLGIPIDLTFALHSDAGKRADDSIIGTLGIYYTNGGDNYTDGTQRINSRMLTDMVMRQIVSDVRRKWEPDWTRRSMWDKSYVEARIPEVPTTLIELLSHQNFGDMQYGLDPAFRFTVSRAIYKALGRFMAERKGREFIVQPLPVSDFSIRRTKPRQYRLEWRPTTDSLEHTAHPTKYIILERSGDELGFHKIGETTSTHYDVRTNDNEIHSFRIIAANEGGLAFASETLAFRESPTDKKPVLIVNGFTRVSGPEHFNDGDRAGFDSQTDFGVPYIKDISYTGEQTEFRRSAGESFGRSSSSYVNKIIAGNTFDYPAVHGESISAAGYGFVSSSLSALEEGHVKLSDYSAVDLILGRQQTTITGKGHSGRRFETFPQKLRAQLDHYLEKGGKLFLSGENIVSDPSSVYSDPNARRWIEQKLGIALDSTSNTISGRLETTLKAAQNGFANRSYNYSNTLNADQYIVQHPDPICMTGHVEGEPILLFSDTDAIASVALRQGKSRTVAMSVPFESITDQARRNALMSEILTWLQD